MKRIFILLLCITGSILYAQENELEELEFGIPEDPEQAEAEKAKPEIKTEDILKGSSRIGLYKYNDKSTEFPYASFSSDIIAVNYGFMPRDDRKLRSISIQYNLSDSTANNNMMTRGVKKEGKGISFSKLRTIIKKEFGKYEKQERNYAEIYTFKDKDGNQARLVNNTRMNIANLSIMLNAAEPDKKEAKDLIYFFGPDKVPIFKRPVTFDEALASLKELYKTDKTDMPDLSGSVTINNTMDLYSAKKKPCLRVSLPFTMIRELRGMNGGFANRIPVVELKPGMKIKAQEWKRPEALCDPAVDGVKGKYKYTIYGVVSGRNAIFKFNPETGESTIIGPLGFNIGMSSLAFHPDGTLWGFSFSRGLNQEEMKKRQEEIQAARKAGKKVNTTGMGQRGLLYKVDTDSGKGTIIQKFNVAGFGGGAGLEWDKKGENIYWSNTKQLCKLNIKTGKVEEFMPLDGGSYCLTRRANGNLLGISIRGQELFEVDLKKKKQKNLKKLKGISSPSMTITQNNQIFIETFGSKIYLMKTINSDPVLLGKTGVCPWGLAIKPKFKMEDFHKSNTKKDSLPKFDIQDGDTKEKIPEPEKPAKKEEDFGFGGIPKPPEL